MVIAVCLRKRRRTHRGDVILNKYLPSITTHSEGVALHETQSDGGKEEIDLEVFQNDQVCTKEEIKLQP